MDKSKKKTLSNLIGVSLGLFLVLDLIAGAASPDKLAVNAALAKCQEKGWHDGDLALSQSKVSSWLVGRTATIDLQTQDGRKAIHMTFRKPINLLGWQLVEYKEEATQP